MKELYETTRKPSGKKRKNAIPVTDKKNRNGRTLTRKKDQLEMRAEHFEKRLNRPLTEPADIPPASHPLFLLVFFCVYKIGAKKNNEDVQIKH